jgi:hypothetical protein
VSHGGLNSLREIVVEGIPELGRLSVDAAALVGEKIVRQFGYKYNYETRSAYAKGLEEARAQGPEAARDYIKTAIINTLSLGIVPLYNKGIAAYREYQRTGSTTKLEEFAGEAAVFTAMMAPMLRAKPPLAEARLNRLAEGFRDAVQPGSARPIVPRAIVSEGAPLGRSPIRPVVKHPGSIALRVLENACFIAGTLLKTETGWVAIEHLAVGDLILSRDESDPSGAVVSKVVEEVFVRSAPVLTVQVSGRVIGTTSEHPFWVSGQGWTPARELRVGDLLVGHDGQMVRVESVEDSGQWAVVYNCRVADYHTYFVGSEEWGFSVWVHNAECAILIKQGEDFVLLRRSNRDILKKGTESEVRTFAAEKGFEVAERIRKITQVKWGAIVEYGETAINHIEKNHYFNSRPDKRTSRFNESNSNPARVKSLTDEAVAKGEHKVSSRGDYSVTHKFDDVIGTDRNGRKTKTLEVFVDENGNVLNSYPIAER